MWLDVPFRTLPVGCMALNNDNAHACCAFEKFRVQIQWSVVMPRLCLGNVIESVYDTSNCELKWLRWSRGSVLSFGTPISRVQTRPKPSDSSGRKEILSTPSFGGEVKACPVPCIRFAACKRKAKSSVNSLVSGQIYRVFLSQ
jgi:hypothetical protein